MNDFDDLNDRFDEATRHLIKEFAQSEEGSFSNDVKTLNLDPRFDFMHSDLAYVNFTGSDLRGYNFTGADLSGCTGYGAIWDDSTNLTDANVSGSIFAYEKHMREFFERNPHWEGVLDRLNRTHWSKSILWVADNIATTNAARAHSIEVAKAYFERSGDAVVRSNVLFFLSYAFEKSADHRDFLIHILSKNSEHPKIAKAAVVVLSSLFSRDPYIEKLLCNLMKDESQNSDVRQMAIRGVINSSRSDLALDHIVDDQKLYSRELRQMYTRRFASSFGKFAVNACTEPKGGKCLDFLEVVDEAKIVLIARRISSQAASIERSGLKKSKNGEVSIDVSFNKMMLLAVDVKDQLLELKANGLPLVFSKDVERLVRKNWIKPGMEPN